METSEHPPNPTQNEDLTPLEQDVLDEYERLAENMKKVLPPPSYPSPTHTSSHPKDQHMLTISS
jgi:hypothetical protein